MRDTTNRSKLETFMAELGRRVRGPGRIYLTGGGTAVLEGWRDMTIDIDIKALPEPAGLFEAISKIKELVSVNVELAAPDDFIPEVPGWQERSRFICRHGSLDFYHYDAYSQALAKIERGHARDLADIEAMFERNLIERPCLWEFFEAIEPRLLRYPAINAPSFRKAVLAVCGPAS